MDPKPGTHEVYKDWWQLVVAMHQNEVNDMELCEEQLLG
jgi:hypothetical protein